ncbi:DMT family transporter [Variovorax sp. PCZ-1]|uniref:DMT family transporter n=1 Tax=Variovorax sp. PCZ-1 TaxID=2835533 RepID=UPI001BCAE205|nr:DMT family transporter [Variovorax sp. PCZ-1]MBS7808701.1 DMT family transporter [Variovorax sp. PCZ-1]
MNPFSSANLFALGAIALWALLAWLGISLSHVPPFLLTGVGLLVGSLIAIPLSFKNGKLDLSSWKLPWQHVLLGVYGLFGFHFLLFIALRHAPPVQANLVNYLWPLGMVVLAPLFLPGVKLTPAHLLAACIGFAGACIAILGRASSASAIGFEWGYVIALGSAFIWASYSLLTKRLALQGKSFATAAIGLFGLVSGLLSLLCHALLEPRVNLSGQDWMLLIALGIGPLGAAFYLWDAALKRGDARQIGILSYITPLASTAVLLIATGQPLSLSIGLAAALIVGAAVLGTRAK